MHNAKKVLVAVFLDGPQFFGWVFLGIACISLNLAILSLPILGTIATAED
jgi:hypothetical protein